MESESEKRIHEQEVLTFYYLGNLLRNSKVHHSSPQLHRLLSHQTIDSLALLSAISSCSIHLFFFRILQLYDMAFKKPFHDVKTSGISIACGLYLQRY
jgi:hypothetical protein